MLFTNVLGQEAAKSSFFRFHQSGKVPHALLITGKEGWGGLPFAWALAQFLLCEQPGTNDACGRCPSCVKVSQWAHPDLHLSFPSVSPKPGAKASSKAFMQEFRTFFTEQPYATTTQWLQHITSENKQGNITADECREIIQELYLKSYEGRAKIQLIWRPEYLGNEGNILLKIIEEPPANTFIILVAEQMTQILPTILSRTQQISLQPIAPAEIAQALQSQLKLAADKAQQIAQISEGSYASAVSFSQHTDHDNFNLLRDWFNAIFTNNGLQISRWVDDISKLGREGLKHFLIYARQVVSSSLRVALMPNYTPPLDESSAGFSHKLAQKIQSEKKYFLIDEAINKALFHVGRNAHVKTQFLHLSIQLQHILMSKP